MDMPPERRAAHLRSGEVTTLSFPCSDKSVVSPCCTAALSISLRAMQTLAVLSLAFN